MIMVLYYILSQVRAGGNGSRQISLRPEWSNRCDWSGSTYSESEIRIQLSIRLFTSCDPLRVALGAEQYPGATLTWGRWRSPPPQPLMVAKVSETTRDFLTIKRFEH